MKKVLLALMATVMITTASAQAQQTKIPESITTPDTVESITGTLRFKDGYPIGDTAAKIQDELDYLHGVESFMNSIQGVSLYALRKGFADAGIKDGDFVYTSKLIELEKVE